MPNTNRMLIIVDAQQDFINGSLPVPGAVDTMKNLAEWLTEHAKDYDFIAMTMDSHPADHMSFNTVQTNGEKGPWPPHCVQGTRGADLYGPLCGVILNSGVMAQSFPKGNNRETEEYSIMDNKLSAARIRLKTQLLGIKQIDVCGLAGDICVLNSIKGLMSEPRITAEIRVLKDFSPSIDGGKALADFCVANDIKTLPET